MTNTLRFSPPPSAYFLKAYYSNQTGDFGTEEHALRRLSVEMGIPVEELRAMPVEDPFSLDLDNVDQPVR